MDLAQWWGQDLSVAASGDLLSIDGTVLGQQRVLRRLLTNPGDYIWHPEYGAGLPGMIGDTLDVEAIKAVITAQIFLEAAVARVPQPVIEVSEITDGVFVKVTYVDADIGRQVTVSFNLSA
jgi:phage baseplate assembly protein W